VNLAVLCDEEQRAGWRERGDDPDRLPAIYANDNPTISGQPADMTDCDDLARGNFVSTPPPPRGIAQGGFEPVAAMIFNEIAVKQLLHGVRHGSAGGLDRSVSA